jgi:hypothetical protein
MGGDKLLGNVRRLSEFAGVNLVSSLFQRLTMPSREKPGVDSRDDILVAAHGRCEQLRAAGSRLATCRARCRPPAKV